MTREESITFYKAHAQRLYNISLRILRDSAQAEEIMQDTILKFITSGVSTTDERQAGAWLTKVCIRKSIDALRKRKREKLFLDEYASEAESSTDESLPESGITPAAVRKAMDGLPEGSKLILNLVLIEGLDYKEISDLTGEREGTLRTQFSRAKARLAVILKKK
jgi:RNA polymerase sigma factor (sigma-70 family)